MARLGPPLLTNGVNRTPASAAATYTAVIRATDSSGHRRTTMSGAAARTPKTLTASGEPIPDAAPARTGR